MEAIQVLRTISRLYGIVVDNWRTMTLAKVKILSVLFCISTEIFFGRTEVSEGLS